MKLGGEQWRVCRTANRANIRLANIPAFASPNIQAGHVLALTYFSSLFEVSEKTFLDKSYGDSCFEESTFVCFRTT